MKLKNSDVKGDFGFKALFRQKYHMLQMDASETLVDNGWILSENIFFTLDEAIAAHGKDIKWPVEIQEVSGIVYVPTAEELKEYE